MKLFLKVLTSCAAIAVGASILTKTAIKNGGRIRETFFKKDSNKDESKN